MCLQPFTVYKICEFFLKLAEIFSSYRGKEIRNKSFIKSCFFMKCSKERNALTLYVIFEADWDKSVQIISKGKFI